MKINWRCLRLLVLASAWGFVLPSALADSAPLMLQQGIASYYSDYFNGRLTANGEIFSNQQMTAAHRWLPFGTKVKITNLVNNKTVIVVINDRGPFVKGRIIDLSKRAASDLDMIHHGLAEVELKVL